MSVAACAMALLFLAAPAIVTGQSPASRSAYYVASSVGEWVTTTDTGRILRDLENLQVGTLLVPRSPTLVTTEYRIVVRDRRSTRTATWTCAPVARCRSARKVGDLSFSGAALPVSPRTRLLVLDLRADEMTRLRTVGARDNERDLGLLVLSGQNGTVDARPLADSIPPSRNSTHLVRVCQIATRTGESDDHCDETSADRLCPLAEWSRCALMAKLPTAVTMDLFIRNTISRRSAIVARAIAVVVAPDQLERTMSEAKLYAGDIAAIREQLTAVELRALQVAAALAIAH